MSMLCCNSCWMSGSDKELDMILNHRFQAERMGTACMMAAVLSLGFYLTSHYMAAQSERGAIFWIPTLAWDSLIPFSPGWIWVYLLYFPICFLPLLFKEIHEDIGLFRRTAVGFTVQFLVALAVFWALPSRMQRSIFEPQGLSEYVLAWFYGIDPGFNIFPSLHVANVAYIACLTGRLKGLPHAIVLWILWALITVSTLFVKQHYLLDLPAGLLLGVASYHLSFSKIFYFLEIGKFLFSDDKIFKASFPFVVFGSEMVPLKGKGRPRMGE